MQSGLSKKAWYGQQPPHLVWAYLSAVEEKCKAGGAQQFQWSIGRQGPLGFGTMLLGPEVAFLRPAAYLKITGYKNDLEEDDILDIQLKLADILKGTYKYNSGE